MSFCAFSACIACIAKLYIVISRTAGTMPSKGGGVSRVSFHLFYSLISCFNYNLSTDVAKKTSGFRRSTPLSFCSPEKVLLGLSLMCFQFTGPKMEFLANIDIRLRKSREVCQYNTNEVFFVGVLPIIILQKCSFVP